MGPAKPNTALFRAVDPRQASYALRAVAIFILLATVFSENPPAYLCVAIPVLLAPFFWLKSGAFGIPVLPVISMLFYVYYAVPLLQGNEALKFYRSDDVFWAALSVGLFIVAASFGAWPFLGVAGNRSSPAVRTRFANYANSFTAKSFSRNLSSIREMDRLIFMGLVGGNLYYLAAMTGKLDALGTYLGLVRAVILSLTSVSCYLLGYARGARILRGHRWVAAAGAFVAVSVLAMSNFLLVGGALNIGAALLGYVLAAKRIPWLAIAVAFALFTVLNAGKFSMRKDYWNPGSQGTQVGLLQMPGIVAQWLAAGVTAAGSAGDGSSRLLERTSLLHMVLAVEAATPSFIPFLNGQTYEMLPKMLIPRFLERDKPESQAALNFLSVRYGRERAEDVGKTTIGWGLVSEAYANFGNSGVLTVGAIFGVLCGMLMRLSATASPLSLAMLITIASTLSICNMEADFSYLMVTLLQTIGAILAFAMLPRFSRRRPAAVMPAMPRHPAGGDPKRPSALVDSPG